MYNLYIPLKVFEGEYEKQTLQAYLTRDRSGQGKQKKENERGFFVFPEIVSKALIACENRSETSLTEE